MKVCDAEGVPDADGRAVRVFTTRPDTSFGMTYAVLAPEHPLVADLLDPAWVSYEPAAIMAGAEVVSKTVSGVDLSERPFKVFVGDDTLLAHSLILATGSSARWLGLPGEEAFFGKGLSACATCDGFFFRDKRIAVVGGGDSALEEALFLTKFASEVVLIHRRDEFRGSRIMQNRAKNHEKISIEWNTQVTDVLGQDKIEGLELTDTGSGEKREMEIEGLFVAIGHVPNTALFEGQLRGQDAQHEGRHVLDEQAVLAVVHQATGHRDRPLGGELVLLDHVGVHDGARREGHRREHLEPAALQRPARGPWPLRSSGAWFRHRPVRRPAAGWP